jgi:hypothetical protein
MSSIRLSAVGGEVGGRLVEHEHGSVGEQGSGDEPLPLPADKFTAPAAALFDARSFTPIGRFARVRGSLRCPRLDVGLRAHAVD